MEGSSILCRGSTVPAPDRQPCHAGTGRPPGFLLPADRPGGEAPSASPQSAGWPLCSPEVVSGLQAAGWTKGLSQSMGLDQSRPWVHGMLSLLARQLLSREAFHLLL